MKKLYLPKKYRNHGLHIWCTQEKKTVTGSPCNHAEKQRFQSRIYNPITKRQDCIRSYETREATEAFQLHLDFKKELIENGYRMVQPEQQENRKPQFLLECVHLYFNHLNDIDVPSFEKKNLTRDHIDTQVRNVDRFLATVQKIEKRISSFPVTAITKKHVSAFDQYVTSLSLSDRSYNAHMGSVRYFIDYLIKDHDVEMKNPFRKVRSKHLHYEPKIITQEEFEKFLSTITEENGIGYKGKDKQKVQYYRPWLKSFFKFSLLTGERRDGIVLLKWKDVKENYIGIPNWKVNRNHRAKRDYTSYAPITQDLAELLLTFKIGDPEEYIIQPEKINRETLKRFITRSFTHFWKVSGIEKEATFKVLRKTYVTRMKEVFGELAKGIKHTNETTEKRHYDAEYERMTAFSKDRLYDFKD